MKQKTKIGLGLMLVFFLAAIPLTLAKEPTPVCIGDGCEEVKILEEPEEPVQTEEPVRHSSGSKTIFCDIDKRKCTKTLIKFNGEEIRLRYVGLNLLGHKLYCNEDTGKCYPMAIWGGLNWIQKDRWLGAMFKNE